MRRGRTTLEEALAPALVGALEDERWSRFDATLVAGGKSNLTYLLRSDAGEVVLRRPPEGPLLPSAHDMRREARIQLALASTRVPVARVLLTDDGALLGVPCYVMAKVDGHVIRGALPDAYADGPVEREALAHALVDALADIHAVVPDQVGLGDLGRPDGFLARQLRRWHGQWQASRTAEVTAVDELHQQLVAQLPLLPPSGPGTLVHGDFRLDNCLMHPTDPHRVAAVLDWELSTLGDPLADLGGLLMFWRRPGEPALGLVPGVTDLPGFPDREQLVHRYQERTARDLSGLPFATALAHYKFAVITQGVSARAAAGAMAGQHFGDLAVEITDIAERGLELLRTGSAARARP